ncbi:MAG: phenylacetate-CoA oxygenase subunit PaaJ [Alphaproteobacteria bacterium RIFCSPHIGHO2_12_FULL_63_12]|nr:MAG: phenylacetate-CoA oxygenase subunit PaaJ [Alphaproteobacteria bacterium RIFCSPHIGHO2_12_FULL_63_12]
MVTAQRHGEQIDRPPPPAAARPAIDQVWSWLEEVPDPEIPVVSVVDLGIVRAVDWEGDDLVVTVTPTYSGCPATAVISLDIAESIRRHGVEKVRIRSQLSPAWTTDWIGAAAREKLKAYGIAPPEGGARCVGDLKNPVVECPRCGSMATEQVSRFGSTPCKASWRCRDCLEPFDYFKSF